MAAISGSIPPEPPPPDSSSTELCFLFLSFLFSLRYAFCFSSCCRKTISFTDFLLFQYTFQKIYNFYPTIYEHSWTTNGLVFVRAKPMSYSLDLPMWLHWLIKNNLCSQLPSVWGGRKFYFPRHAVTTHRYTRLGRLQTVYYLGYLHGSLTDTRTDI